MSDVPPEVLVRILSCLPVKSLLRFRSVSKSLCSLFDSRYFVNLHLNQSMKTNKVLAFLRGFNSSCSSTSYYSLCLDPCPTVVKLETPFNSIGFFPQILSSCNGLICLFRGESNREILLWNPSTRKYKLIPAPIHSPPGSEDVFTIDQVGYDHVNYDYKVIRLSTFSGPDSGSVDSKINVYSLKLNVWQSVKQDFPYHVFPFSCNGLMSHGVCVSGAIHWVVTQKPDSNMDCLVVAFDLSSQSFELVPQPEYSDHYVAIDLGILGGCLCVVGNHEMYCVDIWVMGEYGVKESWRKLVALTMTDVLMSVLPCVRPILYLKNSKLVLLEINQEWFVFYDLEEKKSKQMRFCDASYISSFVYQESLV